MTEAEWKKAAALKYFTGEVDGPAFKLWRGYAANEVTATMYLHGVVHQPVGDVPFLVLRARPNRTLRWFPLLPGAMAVVVVLDALPLMTFDQPLRIMAQLVASSFVFAMIWLPMRYVFRWTGRKLLREFHERILTG